MKRRKPLEAVPQAVVDVRVRRRRSRGTHVRLLAPVLLVLALSAGYVILTHAVPALGAVRERQPGVEEPRWAVALWNLAELVEENKAKAIPAIVIAGAAALVLGMVSRGLAYTIYLAAFLLVIADILILVGALSTVWTDVMRDAGAL